MIEDDLDISQDLESIEQRIRELDDEKNELFVRKAQLQSNEKRRSNEDVPLLLAN